MLDGNARLYVAGRRGLAGSAVVRAAEAAGFTDVVGATSAEVDLLDRDAVFTHLADVRPDALVLAAAKVGGIVANDSFPAEFLSENLRIQVNVMDAARAAGVRRLLFLGSSCIYPKHADQPIRETSLLTGPLEPTNDAYAVAKIAGIMGVQSVRKQYGLPWISAMPTNLYGPGDNFHPEHSHVLPALIRRFDEAARSGAREVVLWGTRHPPPRVPPRRRPRPRRRPPARPLRRPADHQRRGRERRHHPGARRDRRRRRRVRRRHRPGHQPARRDPAQAAGHQPHHRARVDTHHRAAGRDRRDLPVVRRAPCRGSAGGLIRRRAGG